MRQGNVEKAIQQFTHALQINPHDPSSYNNLGITLITEGKKMKASKTSNRLCSWPVGKATSLLQIPSSKDSIRLKKDRTKNELSYSHNLCANMAK